MNIYITLLIILILSISSCFSYLITRIKGCGDPKAINYNKNSNLHDGKICIYEQKGCMDPKFANYNRLATVSCKEECDHCGDYEIDKDKKYNNKVDCIYCKKIKNYKGITPSVSGTNCGSDERCNKIVRDCNQPWSYNYNKYSNIDNGKCKNSSTFEENLIILSNNKKAIVVYKGKNILNSRDSGLHVLIFNNKTSSYIEKKHCTTIDLININKLIDYLRKQSNDKLVVIVSTGNSFELFNRLNSTISSILNEFEQLGGVEKIFKKTSKYVLIGTKTKEIYFEEVSEDPIYYPLINFIESHCNNNPASIFPLTEYTFFGDKLSPELMKKMCGLEASKNKKKYFGLTENKCIIMDNDEYHGLINQEKSSNCLAGIGERGSINSYKIEKVASKNDQLNQKIGIYIYQGSNFTGDELLLTHDYYGINHNYLNRIRSIKIPEDTIIYIEDTNNKLHTIVGPKNIKELNDINMYDYNLVIKSLTIKKIKPDSVVICDTLDRKGLDRSKKNKCLVFSPGKYRLAPYLFLNARYIKMSELTKRVVLYNDTNFASEIAILENNGNLEGIIESPRTIRSVSIL